VGLSLEGEHEMSPLIAPVKATVRLGAMKAPPAISLSVLADDNVLNPTVACDALIYIASLCEHGPMKNQRIAFSFGAAAWIVLSFAVNGIYGQDGALQAGDAIPPGGTVQGAISVKGVPSPQDVLVYILTVPGDFPPSATPVVMDTVKLAFISNVLPIVQGTCVQFTNRDRV
jgi:hypothetical protein